MRRRRRAGEMSVNSEINVVSLIDVMMLLMVIFMITAPIMQGGVDIKLPQADVRPLDPKNGLTITVKQNGSIWVDETQFSFAEFSAGIRALSDKKGGGGVLVRGDDGADYGDVLRVIAAAKAAGITDVGLVAAPLDRR